MLKKIAKIILPDEVLLNKIYILRKQKVMLDRDLAELYRVLPRRLREQVKRYFQPSTWGGLCRMCLQNMEY